MSAETSEQVEKLIQPLPWRVRDDGKGLASVMDAQDVCVFSYITLDEAEFIVRAVNHHEELVAALKAIVEDAIPLSGDDAGCDSIGADLIAHGCAVLAKVTR